MTIVDFVILLNHVQGARPLAFMSMEGHFLGPATYCTLDANPIVFTRRVGDPKKPRAPLLNLRWGRVLVNVGAVELLW